MTAETPGAPRLGGLGSALLLAACGAVALGGWLAFAWVAEDAFITFRTIDNWVNGYGLRWNVDERVQTFTHPLWLLVNAVPYAFTREVPTTTTVLGLLCSFAAWALVARRLSARPAALIVWSGCLAFFPSLCLYATSGFESPLAYLLFTGFALTLVPRHPGTPPRWGALSLLASLGALGRLDHALLYAPPLLAAALAARGRVAWRRVALGAAPLAAWLAFALFYFGFALPNTAPAKQSSAVARADYLREGWAYAEALWRDDPGGSLALAAGLAAALALGGGAELRRHPRAWGCAALGAGGLAYALYVLAVGGDFLSGRLWALPILASLLVLLLGWEALRGSWRTRWRPLALAGAALAALVLGAGALLRPGLPDPPRGVIHGRAVGSFSLGAHGWVPSPQAAKWLGAGEVLRRAAREKGPRVAVRWTIGMVGYTAGPDVLIIDRYGLGDPLLSRLPPVRWSIGHLVREVPRGYVEARSLGDPTLIDPRLRPYYETLRTVVSGPLFSIERLRAILALHRTGPPSDG